MSNIIAGAMQGLGGGIKDAGLEMLRAEITKERDARLNQYAVSLETDVKQPFQSAQTGRELSSREGMQESQIASTEGISERKLASDERIAANKLKDKTTAMKELDARVLKGTNLVYKALGASEFNALLPENQKTAEIAVVRTGYYIRNGMDHEAASEQGLIDARNIIARGGKDSRASSGPTAAPGKKPISKENARTLWEIRNKDLEN